MILRHQLPVHSPIPLQSLVRVPTAGPRRLSGASSALASLLAERFDARKVVLTGSGTQALNLAIRIALEATGSRIVGLPGFCCYDVASAAVGADARIALYDLDPATLAPDAASLERLLATTGAKVVVVAHLYGFPADWDKLQSIADRFGAVLIEDAAQGHGGTWRGRLLGSLGKLSVMSFGRGKGWTGSGGGALLLRGGWEERPVHDLPDAGAAWKVVAGGAAHWMLGRPSVYGLPSSLPFLGLGETRYHPPTEPVRMNAASAAIALRSASPSDLEAKARRASADLLASRLTDAPGVRSIAVLPDAVPGYLRLPVRLPMGMESFPSGAAALRTGIGRSYPTTLDALPVVVERLAERTDLPGAAVLPRELVTLPVHSLMSDSDREAVVALLRNVAPL